MTAAFDTKQTLSATDMSSKVGHTLGVASGRPTRSVVRFAVGPVAQPGRKFGHSASPARQDKTDPPAESPY